MSILPKMSTLALELQIAYSRILKFADLTDTISVTEKLKKMLYNSIFQDKISAQFKFCDF